MKYKGELYGKYGKKYIKLKEDSEYVVSLEDRIISLESARDTLDSLDNEKARYIIDYRKKIDLLHGVLDERTAEIRYKECEMEKLANVIANFNKDCNRLKKDLSLSQQYEEGLEKEITKLKIDQESSDTILIKAQSEIEKLKHIIKGCQSTLKTNAFRFRSYEEKIEGMKNCLNCDRKPSPYHNCLLDCLRQECSDSTTDLWELKDE